jgi:hypothetical protein
MTTITAYFYGLPGGPLDKTCHRIFEQHGGEFVGCGTFLLTGERAPMTRLKMLAELVMFVAIFTLVIARYANNI